MNWSLLSLPVVVAQLRYHFLLSCCFRSHTSTFIFLILTRHVLYVLFSIIPTTFVLNAQ